MDNQTNNDAQNTNSNRIKDPADWSTGNEPMTASQRSYLQTISGTIVDDNLTKSQAAEMIDAYKQNKADGDSNDSNQAGNAIKDPDDWTTGTEEMTGAQESYLKTLATEAGEEPEAHLSKSSASKKIEELQQKTGRGN